MKPQAKDKRYQRKLSTPLKQGHKTLSTDLVSGHEVLPTSDTLPHANHDLLRLLLADCETLLQGSHVSRPNDARPNDADYLAASA